jgi:hypothetical protein
VCHACVDGASAADVSRTVTDITGQVFGHLTILSLIGPAEGQGYIWLCRCMCGREISRRSNKFTPSWKNKNQSCTACYQSRLRVGTKVDLIGRKFSHLTVVQGLGIPEGKKGFRWLCVCDCGAKVNRMASSLLRSRHRYQSCKRCAQNSYRLPPGEVSWNCHYASYIHGARSRGLTFEVTLEQFKQLCALNCHYCGKAPEPYNRYGNSKLSEKAHPDTVAENWINANGLDRLDSKVGYCLSNVKPCCSKCNRSKMNLSVDEFLLMVKSIYENMQLGSTLKCG